jgi:alpha-D-xyloside xylohydrolase
MILEEGFGELEARFVEGSLNSETNPYAMGQTIEKTDQFMFGPSIMVAPFYERQATERRVQIPPGNWYDFYSGKRAGSQETITVRAADLDNRTPLFVRENAVIPLLTRAIEQSDRAYGHPLEVRFYGPGRGTFDLYEDDGRTFDYERGQFRRRRLTVAKNAAGQFQVQVKNLEANGPALFGPVASFRHMTSPADGCPKPQP